MLPTPTHRARTTLLLALSLALAGCAANSAASATATASPTATSVATVTPNATASQPSPSPTVSTETNCTASSGDARVGDLAISTTSVLYGFNADYMLPDGLPAKPLAVTVQNNGITVHGAILQNQPVVGQSAFLISICNTSNTQSHRVTTFGAKLVSLTPYSGQLNVLNACAFLYSRPTGWGGECATGFSPDLDITVQFAASPAFGATATQAPPSAVMLPPHVAFTVDYAFNPPLSPATSVYQLGVGIDGAAPVYPSTLRTQPMLIAPIARHWAGDYCSTAAMQAQIPATIPANTYYACPKM
jgi:hypothetical protein